MPGWDFTEARVPNRKKGLGHRLPSSRYKFSWRTNYETDAAIIILIFLTLVELGLRNTLIHWYCPRSLFLGRKT